LKAQLSSGSIVYKQKKSPTSKNYDGVSDFLYQSQPIDYNQYLGLQVFVANPKTDFVIKDQEGHKYLDHIEYVAHVTLKAPTYFTISKVLFGEAIDAFFNIKDDGGMRGEELQGKTLIGLKRAYSKDEIFYAISNDESQFESPFVLVPFFKSEKAKYDSTKFVIVNMSGKFFDEASQEVIEYDKPLYGGVWTCEVNMMKPRGSEIESMCYVLKNSAGQIFLTDANTFQKAAYDACCSGLTFVKKLADGKYFKNIYSTPFMSVKDYNAQLQTINHENRLAAIKANESTAQSKVKRQKIIQELTAKYGSVITQSILQGKVKIGMNTEMCQLAWGKAFYAVIERVQEEDTTTEVWQHALLGTRLFFKDKVLYRIVN